MSALSRPAYRVHTPRLGERVPRRKQQPAKLPGHQYHAENEEQQYLSSSSPSSRWMTVWNREWSGPQGNGRVPRNRPTVPDQHTPFIQTSEVSVYPERTTRRTPTRRHRSAASCGEREAVIPIRWASSSSPSSMWMRVFSKGLSSLQGNGRRWERMLDELRERGGMPLPLYTFQNIRIRTSLSFPISGKHLIIILR